MLSGDDANPVPGGVAQACFQGIEAIGGKGQLQPNAIGEEGFGALFGTMQGERRVHRADIVEAGMQFQRRHRNQRLPRRSPQAFGGSAAVGAHQATGTAEAAVSDEPGTDVPPATMTSPEARDAWLARIRELLAAGKLDAARASLREFMHRYPDQALPDDLRALGQ